MNSDQLIRIHLIVATVAAMTGSLDARSVIAGERFASSTSVLNRSSYERYPDNERVLKTVSNEAEPASASSDDSLVPLRQQSPDQVFSTSNESDSDRPIRLRDAFPLFSGDASLEGVDPISDQTRNYGVQVFVDYDAFRGVADGSWENNGIRTGFNFATRLGSISDVTGIGLQVGASVGAYDWAGTEYRAQNQTRAETQGFLTYGLYHKPTEDSRIVAGVVQDWMFNYTYGIFGQSPTMSQLRGQLGYAVSASNEFGITGAAHLLSSTQYVGGVGPTTWQSVNQLSTYWHHKWQAGGPDTWIYLGVPSNDRLAGGGSLGDYLVTASASCPLSDAVGVFSSVTYMHQSGAPGPDASNDEAWNFIVGLSIYPGRNARSTTVAGQRWMPLMPVANNGNFLVDTNQGF